MDQNPGFYIFFCCLGGGELWSETTLEAEAEMLGGYWVKHWSRILQNKLALQERLTDYSTRKGGEDGAGGEGHMAARRWKSYPRNTETTQRRGRRSETFSIQQRPGVQVQTADPQHKQKW